MASINGVSIKSLKRFMTHEGPMWQGTLYLNGKKIGQWSNDSCGGPDHFWLDVEKYSVQKLMDEFARMRPDCEYDAAEEIMIELVELTLAEKEYKKIINRGCELMLQLSDQYYCIQIELPNDDKDLSDKEIIEKEKEIIAEKKKELKKETDRNKHEIRIYRGFNDFVVGDPIDLNSILRKG